MLNLRAAIHKFIFLLFLKFQTTRRRVYLESHRSREVSHRRNGLRKQVTEAKIEPSVLSGGREKDRHLL